MHPDPLGDTLMVVQIGFYVIAATVAVLTYIAAKRGLLNTVNTEYQKRVMDRLHKLAEELYAEFDPSSPTYWGKDESLLEALQVLNRQFAEYKEAKNGEELDVEEWCHGAPMGQDVQRLLNLLQPMVSDPFIPVMIREAVVDLLKSRVGVMLSIHVEEFFRYGDLLTKGKTRPIERREESGWLSNRIIGRLYERGCGISQIEAEVHYIRQLIQHYFDCFNPHRPSWWHGKPKPPVPPAETQQREPSPEKPDDDKTDMKRAS